MALIDARPAALDVWYRPGNTFTARLSWPTGTLTGRTFTAALDDEGLGVTIDADTLTVTATPAQTTAGAVRGAFELVETTGGSSQTVLVGTWAPSTGPAASDSVDVAVVAEGADIEVSIAASLATPEVSIDWDQDGWDAFTLVTMTADAPQVFTRTVEDGRGVIAGTTATGGSLREVYVLDGTDGWADSELESVVYAPVAGSSATAQQWHLHRVRERAPGEWEAIAVWTAAVGGGYDRLNTRGVRWDGTTLVQSGGDAATIADRDYLDRTLEIVSVTRTTGFGLWFSNYYVTPKSLLGELASGDLVDTDAVTDNTFDFTAAEVNGVNHATGVVQVRDTVNEATVARKAELGTVRPASNQKRWTPYRLSTRVIGGTTAEVVVEIRRARLGEPLPDWGDPRVIRATILPDEDVPELAVDGGAVAIGGAHFVEDTSGSFGEVTARRV